MKLIYLTPNSYPSRTADDFYTKEMARGFNSVAEDNFLLVVAMNESTELDGIRFASPQLRFRRSQHLFLFYARYFWWIIFNLLTKKNLKDVVFFVGDPNLSLILFFFKKIFRFKYRICTDWHLFYNSWKYNYLVKESDCLITTSERLKNNLIKQLGAQPAKINAVYGGVDLEKFNALSSISKIELRTKLNLSSDDILVSYVGFFKTMGMEKGIDTMIKSLPFIGEKKVKMLLVGGKEEQIEEYAELAQTLGVLDRVIFVGVVPNEIIPTYEKASDILVIPYPDKPHFKEYGFPMKLYEYMAAKKSIIYSKLEIIDEVLSDCAYSFSPDDPKDLAHVVMDIIRNENDAALKAQAAFEKTTSYTWTKKANNILQLLQKGS
ncbi:MAG: glycosyltransferase family 4 protein [Candidatus Paceibacterota bacterium]